MSSTELETVRQERDMIREELHHTKMALETAKLEITVFQAFSKFLNLICPAPAVFILLFYSKSFNICVV